MTRQRFVLAGTIIWLLIFGILSQPHPARRPLVTHARLLDPPTGDLPTLVP